MLSDTNQYKELIEQLKSVESVEIFSDEAGNLSEIHILADQTRTPKQIIRDIESAIGAKFKTKLDHKIISIAQIPSDTSLSENIPRLMYKGVTIDFSNNDSTVTVNLECMGQKFSGSGKCDLDRENRYRTTASATIKAINEYLKNKATLSLKSVKTMDIDGLSVVVASVVLYYSGKSEILIGSCAQKDDSAPTVVRAVLDATNRRISIL